VARGVAQNTVNLADLKDLDVFDVPPGTQRRFTQISENIGNVRLRQLRAGRLMADLTLSLTHAIFGVAA
jgi:hypothetical protein